MYVRKNSVLMVLLMGVVSISHAISQNAINQSAHVHGEATLLIAYENNALEVAFTSPAVNLLGFEHQAITEQEKDTLKQARAKLGKPEDLFTFDGSECELESMDLDSTDVDPNKGNHHHHSHSHEHQHTHDDQHNTHAEINVTYQFVCADNKGIRGLSTHLLNIFQGIEHLEVQWITTTKQGAISLSKSNNSVVFE